MTPDCSHQRSPDAPGDVSCSRQPSDKPIGRRPRKTSGTFQRVRNSRWLLREYVRLKPSHTAGTKDLAMKAGASHPATSPNCVARRLRPVNMLSSPSATVPAKKHHAPRDGFRRTRLKTPSSRLKNPATNGRRKKRLTVAPATGAKP